MLFPARNRLALALTLGLHALVLLFWLQAPRPRLADTAPAWQVVSVLLNVPLRATAPAAAPSSPSHDRVPARRPVPPPAAVPKPAPLPDTVPSPAAPAPSAQAGRADAPSTSPTIAAPSAPDAAAAAAAPSDTGMALDLARRQAGRIDRELRKGKSGVPLDADTPWARFRRGVEAADTGNLAGEQMDSHTASDGVVTYRRRIGKRTLCRRSGSVGPGIAGLRGINDAGDVPCPSGVEWKRE